MSKKGQNPDPAGTAGDAGGPSLGENPELEAALREAVESVDKSLASAEDEIEIDMDLDGDDPVGPPPVDSIEDEIDLVRDELIQTKDKHVRLQADFENFRRRALKERQELLQFGHENLVKDLLSTVDNLERAIEHTQQSAGGELESLLQGVEMLQRELFTILEKHSVTKIEAMGSTFDPALHEAMAQAPDASVTPNTVVGVFQEGYQLRGRLLRPSRVVVARKPEENEIDGGDAG